MTGYIVRYPMGAMTWHFLQFILGLKRLGCDVYFLENSPWSQACYNPELNIMTDDASYGIKYLNDIMNLFDMSEKWVFIDYAGNYYGLNKSQTKRLLKRVDALVDCSGCCWLPEWLGRSSPP